MRYHPRHTSQQTPSLDFSKKETHINAFKENGNITSLNNKKTYKNEVDVLPIFIMPYPNKYNHIEIYIAQRKKSLIQIKFDKISK